MKNISKLSTILMKVISIADIILYCFGAVLMLIGTLIIFFNIEKDWSMVWLVVNCFTLCSLGPFLLQIILLIIGFIVSRKDHTVFTALWLPERFFSVSRVLSLAIATLPVYLLCLPILHLVFKWLLLSYGIIIALAIFKIIISVIPLIIAGISLAKNKKIQQATK